MPSPLIVNNDGIAIMPSCFCADIAYYAALASFPFAVIDSDIRYDKRAKHTHRTTIASTHGPMTLTIPVQKPPTTHDALWSQILVSSHDDWWHIHTTALESAYGRTPFFEFYADMILPLLGQNAVNNPITELNAAFDSAIRSILGIDTIIVDSGSIPPGLTPHDYRRKLPVLQHHLPYYQVRAQQLGFIPGLSILDLIFNLGPEAPLYLKAVNSPQESW